MKQYVIGAILALALCAVSVATSQTAPTAQEKRQTLGELRTKVQTARDHRCRHPYQFEYRIRAMPDSWLRGFIRWTRGRVDYERDRSSRCLPTSPIAAIRYVFGSYADQAISVANCETGGTFSLSATNGQYVGLFQMGYSERLDYGWYVAGAPAMTQVRSAYRYFVASGRDWSPWQCQPGGYLQW